MDDADSVLLTFVTENGNQANLSTDAKLVYEVNSNYLHAMSEYADKYMRAFDNNGDAITPEAKSLNDEFKAIYAAIKTISGGDLVLGHGLTIKLNGETLLDNWMAQEDGSINIELNSDDIKDWSTKLDEEFANRADTKYVRYDKEQTLTPEQQAQARENIGAAPIADYVVKGADGKIDINDLPDTVVGGLQYKGVYDASVAGSIVPEMGDYYIVSESGNYDPAGGVHTAANPELKYFLVGDWAIYNGAESGWAKIDNTDAVKTVNGQIGAVKTYKGVYSEEADYYAGDWVLVNGILYLAVQNSKGQSVEDEAYWQVAGRIYEGEKGIAINGNKIGHTNTLTRVEQPLVSDVKAKGGQFSVDVNEYDEQGHVVSTQKQNITLSQTWREVKVGDTVVVAKDSDEALNVVGNAPINVSGSNHAIYVEHAAGVEVKDAIELTVESAGEVVANIVKSDSFGHVNGTRELKLANLAIKDGDQNLTGVKTLSTADGQNGAVILPGATEKYDLGSESAKFNGIYAKEFKGNLIGNAKTASAWAEQRSFSISINSGMGPNSTALVSDVVTRKVDGSSDRAWEVTLAKSGVKAGAYTAVRVNEQGIVTGGAQAIEFGETVNAGPSDALVYGGLFFRMIESD